MGRTRKYSREQILVEITENLTTSVEIAGAAYGLGRNASYEAVRTGHIKAVRLNGKITCPTAPIRADLGIEKVA